MLDKSIELFSSKEYRFLSWLERHEQKTSRGVVINFSQEEIAAEHGSSPATVNKWIQALQSANCVEQKKKGSYSITQTGHAVITKMTEIEKLLGGKRNG